MRQRQAPLTSIPVPNYDYSMYKTSTICHLRRSSGDRDLQTDHAIVALTEIASRHNNSSSFP
jgi:hypothetical protein